MQSVLSHREQMAVVRGVFTRNQMVSLGYKEKSLKYHAKEFKLNS